MSQPTAIACLFALALCAGTAATQVPTAQPAVRPFVLVAVVDGLRPDSITAEGTPTLFRVQEEGVSYRASHAAFPTVTRVNAATIATGTWPERHGIVSNSMFVPQVHPTTPFSTGEWRELLKLRDVSGGRLLFTKTLAEILHERGLTLVAASSGSTGSGFLLNPRAPDGIGALVSGGLEKGRRVAFPDTLSEAILQRFGPSPATENAAAVDWTERVLREHIVPSIRPDVLITWLTEPDGSQHDHGVGSPQARAALKNSDRNLGLMLETLSAQGLSDRAHVIVTSDHGFVRQGRAVNFKRALIGAGLKASAESDDVVMASDGQSVLVHVKGHDADRIRRIVELLQSHVDVDVIFTRAASPPSARPSRIASPVHGWVPGTFALDLVHAANETRGADILFTLGWSATPNSFGVAGTQVSHSDTREGPIDGDVSSHGGLNPWTVRNTLILWGPRFKGRTALDAPAGNVDITPTVLALLGIAPPADVQFDGRVLEEAFRERPSTATPSREAESVWSETLTATHGTYTATVRVSGIGSKWYVDEGSRVRPAARAVPAHDGRARRIRAAAGI